MASQLHSASPVPGAIPSPDHDLAKPAGPGRPKDLAKRQAILEAAKKLFVHEGMGVSMDQIAATAGVSKLTVYSHFGDKETLFGAAIRAVCEEAMPDDLFLPAHDGPLRDQLLAIARAFFAMVSSDEAVATHRMMQTPGALDGKVVALFWEAGPARIHAALTNFLAPRVARGELQIDDVPRAASQFFALIKGEVHAYMMCGLGEAPDVADISSHLAATVDFFLRAYEPR